MLLVLIQQQPPTEFFFFLNLQCAPHSYLSYTTFNNENTPSCYSLQISQMDFPVTKLQCYFFSFFFFKHFHLFKSTPTRDTKADRRQEVIMLYSFLQCRSTGMPCLGNSTWWEAAELPAPPHVVLEEPSRCLFLPLFCQV